MSTVLPKAAVNYVHDRVQRSNAVVYRVVPWYAVLPLSGQYRILRTALGERGLVSGMNTITYSCNKYYYLPPPPPPIAWHTTSIQQQPARRIQETEEPRVEVEPATDYKKKQKENMNKEVTSTRLTRAINIAHTIIIACVRACVRAHTTRLEMSRSRGAPMRERPFLTCGR